MEKFLEFLKQEESKFLSRKTSFGRNELQILMNEAKINALAKYMEFLKLQPINTEL